MKKYVLIALGVAVVGVAGWSALWFAGRGQIEDQVAAEAERLRAKGYEVSYLESGIGGFPLGYEARYEAVRIADPEGRVVTLPWLIAGGSVEAPGRIRFRFPERFTAEMPFPPEIAKEYDDAPEALAIDVEADGLVVETEGRDGAASTIEAEARSILIVTGSDTQPVSAGFELTGFEGALTVPNTDAIGRASGRAAFERLDYTISTVDPAGTRTTAEGISDDFAIAGSSKLLTREAWQRFLTGETEGADAEFSYQAGETVSQVQVAGNAEGLDGLVHQAAGTTGGLIRVADGAIELRASAENNRFELQPADADAPVRGAITLESLETVYVAPIAPAEEMAAFTMRVAASGLEIDEAIWTLFDPSGLLERGRAHAILEVSGTGRMLERPADEAGPVSRGGIELGNVVIDVVDIAALGATVTAEGAIEFIQPLNLPQGQITVEMANVLDLAGDLQALGLLDEQSFQLATLMSTVYTKPGATETERSAEIVFAPDGITINGLPVQ